MKRKFSILLLFSLFFIKGYCQITIKEINKKIEKEVEKPPPYDSLKDFKMYDGNNQELYYKQYIGLKIFVPPNDNNIVYFSTGIKNIRRYFTIIDIKKNDHIHNFSFQNREVAFLVKDDSTGDSLIIDEYLPSFGIFVPYFVKQKQMFDGKAFILLTDQNNENENIDKTEDKFAIKDIYTNKRIKIKNRSKWQCEVSLMDKNKVYQVDTNKTYSKDYKMFYIFKNDTNTIAFIYEPYQGLTHSIPYSGIEYSYGGGNYEFIMNDVYAEQQKEKKLQKEQLLAKEKRNEQRHLEIEKQKNEQLLKYCVNKFGENLGFIIAQGKVRIGMTSEMCEIAWGKPFNKDKTTTSTIAYETWHYGWKKTLYFENGNLIQIDE